MEQRNDLNVGDLVCLWLKDRFTAHNSTVTGRILAVEDQQLRVKRTDCPRNSTFTRPWEELITIDKLN